MAATPNQLPEQGSRGATRGVNRCEQQPGGGRPVSSPGSGALPPNRYSQSEITEVLTQLPQFAPHADLLRRFHQTAKVSHRHLAPPLEQYPG